MDPRYPETWGDPGYVQRPARPPGRRDWNDRRVCKQILPPASPGAISTNCPNAPVNDFGFCAEHAI